MLPTEKGRRKGTESAQRDKPLDGSRGEASSFYYFYYLHSDVIRLSAWVTTQCYITDTTDCIHCSFAQ